MASHELSKTYQKGHQETVAYYEQIPGVKEPRDIYEEAKLAQARGEEIIHIVG